MPQFEGVAPAPASSKCRHRCHGSRRQTHLALGERLRDKLLQVGMLQLLACGRVTGGGRVTRGKTRAEKRRRRVCGTRTLTSIIAAAHGRDESGARRRQQRRGRGEKVCSERSDDKIFCIFYNFRFFPITTATNSLVLRLAPAPTQNVRHGAQVRFIACVCASRAVSSCRFSCARQPLPRRAAAAA